MGQRRDDRRFGAGPYIVGLQPDLGQWTDDFPYDVPAVGWMVGKAMRKGSRGLGGRRYQMPRQR